MYTGGLFRQRWGQGRLTATEKHNQAGFQFRGKLQLTIPDGENFPARRGQCGKMFRVAFLVPRNLGQPVFQVAFGFAPAFAAVMTVPEAAMDKYCFPPPDKRQIRPPGNVAPVEPVPCIAKFPDDPSHSQFRPSVFRLDAPHIFGAADWLPFAWSGSHGDGLCPCRTLAGTNVGAVSGVTGKHRENVVSQLLQDGVRYRFRQRRGYGLANLLNLR